MLNKVILIAVTFLGIAHSFEDVDDEVCIGISNGMSIAIANSCNYYYSCLDQIGFLENCGTNYVYDSRTNNCIFSDKIDCRTQSVKKSHENSLKDICMGYIDKVLLRVIGSCSKFYVCKNEMGYVDDCAKFGPNFYFESSSASCVEGNQYNCINGNVVHLISRLTFEKIKVSPPDYDLSLCRGYEDGNIFGIEGSCSHYYFCADQIAYLQNCKSYGDEYQFDTNINDCNHKSITKCDENFDILK